MQRTVKKTINDVLGANEIGGRLTNHRGVRRHLITVITVMCIFGKLKYVGCYINLL